MARGVEADRLEEARTGVPWRRWGPYLSERQWGTVREDYSDNGDAWSYFSHDQARSRAYKWGEDGIAGFCDDHQRLCFAVALWNGVDPILKERMFGLTNAEGNHGEDVKEYYFYLDATPTSSYLKYRYRTRWASIPYDDLVATNRARSRLEMEYELIDTGVFDDDRYVDVDVEYAKAVPRTSSCGSRSPTAAPRRRPIHLLPTLWFRNTWWMGEPKGSCSGGRRRRGASPRRAPRARRARAALRGRARRCCSPRTRRTPSGCGARRTPSPYVKDAFHEYVVARPQRAPSTRLAPARRPPRYYVLEVPAGGARVVHLQLCRPDAPACPTAPRSTTCSRRASPRPTSSTRRSPRRPRRPTRPAVMRQALAGMLWSKQHYFFDLDRWLEEHDVHPLREARRSRASGTAAGSTWSTTTSSRCPTRGSTRGTRRGTSPSTRWRCPWSTSTSPRPSSSSCCASCTSTRAASCPPTSGTSATSTRRCTPGRRCSSTRPSASSAAQGDVAWLKSAFQKLLVNFTWWVNRKDPTGRNVFEGGFLGLDNIGVFDRSAPLPTGGHLEQSDGTAWMAFFSQCMLGIAARAVPARPALRGHGPQVRRALRVHRRRDGPHRRQPGRAVGRGGRLLLRRAAPPRRAGPAAQGAVDGRAAAAVRDHDPAPRGTATSSDELVARLRRRIDGHARAAGDHPRRPPARRQRPAHAGRARRDEAAPDPGPDARRGRVPRAPTGCGRCPATTSTTRSASTSTARRYEVALPAGRVRHRDVRRQLELAGPGVVPGQLPHPARPAAPLRLLRRRLHGGVPDRLGQPVHAVRGGHRARPAAVVDLPARTPTAAGPSTAAPSGSRPTRTGRTWCCSTSTSTATTAPASAPATRPAGPASSPGSSRCSATSNPTTCCRVR